MRPNKRRFFSKINSNKLKSSSKDRGTNLSKKSKHLPPIPNVKRKRQGRDNKTLIKNNSTKPSFKSSS
jgi:hypothetical protein